MTAPEPPIVVDVLTGFLGAGKTSYLRRLLDAGVLADAAILVNEFADLPVDQRLLGATGSLTSVLAGGCLCCAVDGDLKAGLLGLLQQRADGIVPPFARILVETSGIADPVPVASTILGDRQLQHRLRFGGTVTVVDLLNLAETLATQDEAVAQIIAADRIVLSKADLVEEAQRAEAIASIAAINPLAPIMETRPQSEIDHQSENPRPLAGEGRVRDLLEVAGEEEGRPSTRPSSAWRQREKEGELGASGGADRPALIDPWRRTGWTSSAANRRPAFSATAETGDRHQDLSSLVLDWPEPVDWAVFSTWLSALLHRHGNSILRVKGLMRIAGETGRGPVLIQGVRHVVYTPEHLDEAVDIVGAEIVVIVRGRDAALIRRSFRAFMGLAAPARTAEKLALIS